MDPVLSAAFCLLLSAASAFVAGGPAYRELPCRVVGERGAPVRNITVFLDGLDRFSGHLPQDNGSLERPAPWVFTTDKEGRCTVRFGKFQAIKHWDATGVNEPGYGRFHLVVVKRGWAGGVSRQILNLDDEALAKRRTQMEASGDPSEEYEDEEWQHGEFAPLVLADRAPARLLVIVLKRGLELHGRMLDPAGHPVSGAILNVSADLHANTHTGYGGEIFEQKKVTDHAGRFRFQHVYPNVFTVGIPGENLRPLYWIRTQVRSLWADRIVDEITPWAGGSKHPRLYEKLIRMSLVVAHEQPYRYFGRITDPKGQGVGGLKVLIQNSAHEPARNYGDEHGSQETHTDAQGNYSLRVWSRFVNWIQVRPGGQGDETLGEVSAEGNTLLAPGRYDFKVNAGKAGE